MAKPLKLDRDGKLAVPEADVEAEAEQLLTLHGWIYIPTKAENLKRNGAPAHKRATLDGLAFKPLGEGWIGITRTIVFEWKKRKANTAKKHLAEQVATEAELERRGVVVYRTPENHPDPIGHFTRWIKARGL